jgi:hypothetical protein
MFKLPRYREYKQPDMTVSKETEPDMTVSKETEPDKEWSQHVTLPLHPASAEYDKYLKAGGEPVLISKSASMISQGNNARLGNEHILSALGDLIRALDINGKEVIDYILANDLVRGEATEEP